MTDILDTGRAGGMAIRGGALRVLGYGGALLLSLVSVPFMTRHLGVSDYGHYITVSSIIFIIGGLTEAGLTNLGTREYSVLEAGDREQFLRNLTGLRFALTATGVALATLLTWVTGAETVVVQGTLITGVALMLTLTQQTYAIPLAARLKLGSVTALELVKQGLLTGTILVLVALGAGLIPFFVASVVSGLGVLIVTMFLLRGQVPMRPAVSRRLAPHHRRRPALRRRGGSRAHLLPHRRDPDVVRVDRLPDRHLLDGVPDRRGGRGDPVARRLGRLPDPVARRS